MSEIKDNFKEIFDSNYDKTLESFNQIIDMERSQDEEFSWMDQIGRISGKPDQNLKYLSSYQKVLENELKLSQLETET